MQESQDSGSITGLERSRSRKWQLAPEFCLESSIDRGSCQATVHGAAKSWIQLSIHITFTIWAHGAAVGKISRCQSPSTVCSLKCSLWCQIRSDQISHSVLSDILQPHESQHARPPCPSPTPGVHWDSRPSSQWCHPAISSSVVPFFSCPQSLPASESFTMSQLFAWGGQSTGVSALAVFIPKKSQGWSSEWTGWISLQSKGLSRVSSNTTVQKHQFFGTQPSSQSNSHIHTWPQEKP